MRVWLDRTEPNYDDGGLKCRCGCNYVKLQSSHRFHLKIIIIGFYDSFAVDYNDVGGLALLT